MNLNEDTYHKRSTYDELVIETSTNPTDTIELSDRVASILSKSQKPTELDDEDFINLDEDNKKILTYK